MTNTTPATAAPAAAPALAVPSAAKQELHHHHKILAAMFSGVFAAAVGVIVIWADTIGPTFTSLAAGWWGLVGGIYVLTQIAPLTGYNPLEEYREKADIMTSPLAAAVIFLVIPAVYITRGVWPNYWAWKIWIISIPFSIADLLLLLVLYRISRATVRTTTV